MKTQSLIQIALLLDLLSRSLAALPLGTAFTYQGRLAVGGSSPDPAERFEYRFSVFDVPTGGIRLTDPVTHASVPYADGLFTVPLDFGSACRRRPYFDRNTSSANGETQKLSQFTIQPRKEPHS